MYVSLTFNEQARSAQDGQLVRTLGQPVTYVNSASVSKTITGIFSLEDVETDTGTVRYVGPRPILRVRINDLLGDRDTDVATFTVTVEGDATIYYPEEYKEEDGGLVTILLKTQR